MLHYRFRQRRGTRVLIVPPGPVQERKPVLRQAVGAVQVTVGTIAMAGGVFITGVTLVEDAATGGVGILNDPALFSIGGGLITLGYGLWIQGWENILQ